MIDIPLVVFLALLTLMFGFSVRFDIRRRHRLAQGRRETTQSQASLRHGSRPQTGAGSRVGVPCDMCRWSDRGAELMPTQCARSERSASPIVLRITGMRSLWLVKH